MTSVRCDVLNTYARREASLSRLELTPACCACGRAVCRLLQGQPWHVSIQDQESLINACRALKGWKPRALAMVAGDQGEEAQAAVWDEACEYDSDL